LKLGDIRARSRAISKAMAIVTELSLSLDHAHGGELSKSLADLYAHAEILLIKANCEQSDLPLAEAERLLSTLSEAWQGVAPADQAAQPQTSQSTPYQPIRCAY
jgi:flagellar protein FliS